MVVEMEEEEPVALEFWTSAVGPRFPAGLNLEI